MKNFFFPKQHCWKFLNWWMGLRRSSFKELFCLQIANKHLMESDIVKFSKKKCV